MLQQQVLAALLSAPGVGARAHMDRIEPDDFEDWISAEIFRSMQRATYAPHPEPGSIIVQINADLLNRGLYRDTDNGLRAAVLELAGITGHPERLPSLVSTLIEHRFRREVGVFALAAAEHADRSPLPDVYAALSRIDDLRRLRARLPDFINVTHLDRKGA